MDTLRRLYPKHPAAKLKEPKLDKRIPNFLSELEIEHLREAVIQQWRMRYLSLYLDRMPYWGSCKIKS